MVNIHRKRRITVRAAADAAWEVVSGELHELLKCWPHLELLERDHGLDAGVVQRFEAKLWCLVGFGGGVRVTDIDDGRRWCRGEVIDARGVSGTVSLRFEPLRGNRRSRLHFEFDTDVKLPEWLLGMLLNRLDGFLDSMGESIAQRLAEAAGTCEGERDAQALCQS